MTVSAFGIQHTQIRKDDDQSRHLAAGALLAGGAGYGLHHTARSLHGVRQKSGLATIGAMLSGDPAKTRKGLKALALSHKGAELAHAGSKAGYLAGGVLGAAALGSAAAGAQRRRRPAPVPVQAPQGEKTVAKSAFGVTHPIGKAAPPGARSMTEEALRGFARARSTHVGAGALLAGGGAGVLAARAIRGARKAKTAEAAAAAARAATRRKASLGAGGTAALAAGGGGAYLLTRTRHTDNDEPVVAKSAFGVMHKASMHLGSGGLWVPGSAPSTGSLWTPGGHAAPAKPSAMSRLTGAVKTGAAHVSTAGGAAAKTGAGKAAIAAGKRTVHNYSPINPATATRAGKFVLSHKGATAAAAGAAAAGAGVAHYLNRGARAAQAAQAARKATNISRAKKLAVGGAVAGGAGIGAADLGALRRRRAQDKREAAANRPPPRYGSPR